MPRSNGSFIYNLNTQAGIIATSLPLVSQYTARQPTRQPLLPELIWYLTLVPRLIIFHRVQCAFCVKSLVLQRSSYLHVYRAGADQAVNEHRVLLALPIQSGDPLLVGSRSHGSV